MTTFIRLASDVTTIPKAPDITFTVRGPDVMTAEVDGFKVRVENLHNDRAHVRVSLDGEPYCACEYIHTFSHHFAEEDFTAAVDQWVGMGSEADEDDVLRLSAIVARFPVEPELEKSTG